MNRIESDYDNDYDNDYDVEKMRRRRPGGISMLLTIAAPSYGKRGLTRPLATHASRGGPFPGRVCPRFP